MDVYILIALDESNRVRESVVVSDEGVAKELYALLRKIWGGDKVSMASRKVDDIPDNLIRAFSAPFVKVVV